MGYFLRSVGRFLLQQWHLVAVILVAIACQLVFRLAVPMAFKQIFDRAVANKDLQQLVVLLAVLLGLWLVQAVSSMVQDLSSARVGLRVVHRLRDRLLELVVQLPASRMQQLPSGDILSCFSSDLATVEQALVQGLHVVLFSTVNLVLSLALIFYLSWQLALLALLGMLLCLLAPRLVAARATDANYRRKGEEGRLLSTVQELVQGHEVVRTLNLVQLFQQRVTQLVQRFDRQATQAYRADAMVSRLGSQSAALLQVLIMLAGAYLVIVGSLTIGTVIAFIALMQNLVAAISFRAGAMPLLHKANGSLRRINELLAFGLPPEGSPAGSRLATAAVPRPQRELSCHDLGFAYLVREPGQEATGQEPGTRVTALRSLSFTCPIGSRTAIVGPSGAGKSTLVQLLIGCERATTGQIRVDGQDLAGYSGAAWREHLGVVPQRSFLFQMSLRENIRLGRLDATDQEVEQAAVQAGLHELISSLPGGYETCLSEGGSNLSGGQQQRLAIARALLREPAVLVLDEATSALDPATEQAIIGTIEAMQPGRITISVTHRLQTIVSYDQVLVLQEGALVEHGTHQELLAAGGLYRSLWDKQQGIVVSGDGCSASVTPERLRRIPILAGLGQAELARLAGRMVSERLAEGRVVCRKGEPAERFYLIADGMVEVSPYEVGSPRFRKLLLETGDFFGELALLASGPRTATVTTLRPTLLLSLSRRRFDELLDLDEEIRQSLLQVAAARRELSDPM